MGGNQAVAEIDQIAILAILVKAKSASTILIDTRAEPKIMIRVDISVRRAMPPLPREHTLVILPSLAGTFEEVVPRV
jgi:hypothetical protein